MKRLPFICANWKMNKGVKESEEFFKAFHEKVKDITDREIGLCVPYISLDRLSQLKKKLNSPIKLGAENMHYEESGAFTGEISYPMLEELEIDYVIIGHSERRHIFGETDDILNKKLRKLDEKQGIKPIFCVGELLEEREAGKTLEVLSRQLKEGLKGISPQLMEKMVIAYEPVWAIGTGKNATVDDAKEAISFIRKEIASLYGEEIAGKMRIQYGGSVKPHNIDTYMKEEEIDGALVGGASLKVDSFYEVVTNWENK